MEAFPPHTYAEWKEAAEQLLKGRPFEKTLITPTHEGIDLQPIYTRETLGELAQLGEVPGLGSRVRGSEPAGKLEGGWLVSQELSAPTPGALNAVLLKELENGQNEVNLWLDRPSREGRDADAPGAESVGVCGLSVSTLGDLREAFQGVRPEMVSFYLHSGTSGPAVYALFLAWLKESKAPLEAIRGCLGIDPLGWMVESGNLPGDPQTMQRVLVDLIGHARRNLPNFQVLDVQGHPYHNGGANSVQEMAAVLASAVGYLKGLQDHGVKPADLVPRMRLSLSIGSNYFMEVAKFRAIRMLWSRVLDGFDVPEEARRMHIHGRTGLWNKTLLDPYVNLLRTTTEAFSAVVGGCDSLHVGPFDEVIRESDAFSRRIARNTHHILAEECHMTRVLDPGGGSWAVETLTDQIAAAAWKAFQEIEANGGILQALTSGTLQDAIDSVRQARLSNIQKRKEVIIGTNTYPNATEKLLEPRSIDYATIRRQRATALETWRANRDGPSIQAYLVSSAGEEGETSIDALVNAARAGATLGELHAHSVSGEVSLEVRPIRLRRAAEEFEQLRLAARALAESGQPAQVHQLNIGPSRAYRMRADWTTAFFQVGGLEVISDTDYPDAGAAVEALSQSGAPVAVITSDDETYAATIEDLARAIGAAGLKCRVMVAGAPGDHEAAWRAAGVDDFVHVRVNNYQFNRKLLESLGARF